MNKSKRKLLKFLGAGLAVTVTGSILKASENTPAVINSPKYSLELQVILPKKTPTEDVLGQHGYVGWRVASNELGIIGQVHQLPDDYNDINKESINRITKVIFNEMILAQKYVSRPPAAFIAHELTEMIANKVVTRVI